MKDKVFRWIFGDRLDKQADAFFDYCDAMEQEINENIADLDEILAQIVDIICPEPVKAVKKVGKKVAKKAKK